MTAQSPRAFALLLTLLLLVLAAVSLAGIARWSLLDAVAAKDAATTLQHKWAAISIQQTLLPRVPRLLARAENASRGRPPAAHAVLALQLGDVVYDLHLTDEQAKLNLNHLATAANGASAVDIQDALKGILRADRLPAEGVRVRPRLAASESSLPLLGSYGQLFQSATPSQLLGSIDRPGLVASITCWGDGRLNIRRASDAAIRERVMPTLSRSEAALLIRLRDENPDQSLAQILTRSTGIDERARVEVAGLLTDQSRCFGIWVVPRGVPTRAFFAIAEGTAPPQIRSTDLPGLYTIVRRHDCSWGAP